MATTMDARTVHLAADTASLRLRNYLTEHPHAAAADVVSALARIGTPVNVRMVEYVRQFIAPQDSPAEATYVYHDLDIVWGRK
jgi:hypothetical protein